MNNEKRTAVDDICDALVDLLFETPLTKIKIKDIVDKAGINKSSYYYHFYSKEDVDYLVICPNHSYVIECKNL